MSDEYPTPSQLDVIRKWDARDPKGLMKELEELWSYPDYFKYDEPKLELHTGGWSGNEVIIEALEYNVFWTLYWQKSERGGHYYFDLRRQPMDCKIDNACAELELTQAFKKPEPKCDKCQGRGMYDFFCADEDGEQMATTDFCTCPAGQRLREGG